MLAEEMRILYVALTRAREKLILVAAFRDLEKEKSKWQRLAAGAEDTLTYPGGDGGKVLCRLDLPSAPPPSRGEGFRRHRSGAVREVDQTFPLAGASSSC